MSDKPSPSVRSARLSARSSASSRTSTDEAGFPNLENPSLVTTPQGAEQGNYFPRTAPASPAQEGASARDAEQPQPVLAQVAPRSPRSSRRNVKSSSASAASSEPRQQGSFSTVDSPAGAESLRQQLAKQKGLPHINTSADSTDRNGDEGSSLDGRRTKGKQKQSSHDTQVPLRQDVAGKATVAVSTQAASSSERKRTPQKAHSGLPAEVHHFRAKAAAPPISRPSTSRNNATHGSLARQDATGLRTSVSASSEAKPRKGTLLSRRGTSKDSEAPKGSDASVNAARRGTRGISADESSSAAQSGVPFSLAGAQQPATQIRRRRPSTRFSSSNPPLGVAIPMPQPKQQPSWQRQQKGPLYSLGKPLPTKEEVEAQKEWEKQMEAIKKMYPDAQPPGPPPLPSQQHTIPAVASPSGVDGIGTGTLDPVQLANIVRSVIAEYRAIENGESSLSPVEAQDYAYLQGHADRRAAAEAEDDLFERGMEEQALSPSERQQNREERKAHGDSHTPKYGSDLSRLNSMVIEDEEGPPIEEEMARRNLGSARASRRGERRSQGGTAESRASNIASEQKPHQGMPAQPGGDAPTKEFDDAQGLKLALALPLPAAPASHKARSSSPSSRASETREPDNGEGSLANGERTAVNSSDGASKGSQRVERLSNANEIYGRDHENEGNWSDEDDINREPSDVQHTGDEYELGDDVEAGGSDSEDGKEGFPNPIAKLRFHIREPAAEFLGAFVLAIIGTGANVQNSITSNNGISPTGRASLADAVYLSAPLAWGIGVALSIYIAGGISGGHISPVISIVLAAFRGFPWRKVPVYILAQILGFTAGSGTVFAIYRRAISIVEGGTGIYTLGNSGTASYFATYPLAYLSSANAWFQEFVNATVLLVLILAIGDFSNVPPPAGLNPIIIMFAVTAIGLSMGIQTGYCLNPARDLGPRLVSWWVGYGRDVWDYRNQYWLWCCWLADICGGLFGAFLYDFLIFTGGESPLNWKWNVRDLNPIHVAKKVKRYVHDRKTMVQDWAYGHKWRHEVKQRGKREAKEEV